MLLKKAKEYALNKLCTIILFEADFNMNNKIFGQEAMYTAKSRWDS